MPRWRDIFEVAEAAEAAERANATARRGGGGGGARVLLRNRAALRGEPQCFVHGNGNSMKVKANEPLWREMMAACRPDEADTSATGVAYHVVGTQCLTVS